MTEPKPGEVVSVRGTVLRTHGFDREESYRVVELQLPDGQHLATNARNIATSNDQGVEVKAVSAPAEDKSFSAPAETKRRRTRSGDE